MRSKYFCWIFHSSCQRCAWEMVAVWYSLIFAMSSVPADDLGGPDFSHWGGILYYISRKIAHVTEYFVLTFLLHRALKLAPRNPCPRPLLPAFFLALILAALDEYHQTFVFGRTGNILDIFVDSLGMFLALASCEKLIEMNF